MAFLCVFVILLLAIGALTLRPRSSGTFAPGEDLDIFALSARYRPMLRLLDGSDFELLNDSGDPKLIRRIRSQRRAIFRGYLRSLGRDQRKLSAQIRSVMVAAETDRKDLASALFRMNTNFRLLMLAVNFRLVIHSAGIGTVPAERLMNCFEQLRGQAEILSGSPAMASSSAA